MRKSPSTDESSIALANAPTDEPTVVSEASEASSGETAAEVKPAPHAIVTRAAVQEAITAGAWTHDNPSTQLWLNSAFPPAKRDAEELIADLQTHGIEAQ